MRGAAPGADTLCDLARRSGPLMAALRAARALGLPQACIAAGAVRSLAWQHLHQRPVDAALAEVDLVYWDADEPPEAQEVHQQRLGALLPGPLWDVVNQAHVHRWYGRASGIAVAPLPSAAAGIATWPETATAIGLWLDGADRLQVVAPLGEASLADLLAGRLRHNPARVPVAVAAERVRRKRWLQRWPRLQPVGALADALAPTPGHA